MARFTSIEVYNAILEQGLVPVFYNGDLGKAKNIVQSIANAGGKIIEFTNRGDFALEVFVKLIKHF